MAFCNNVRSSAAHWERLSSAKHDEYLASARRIAYITIQRRDLSFAQSDAGLWLGWYDSFSMIGFHFLPLLVLNGVEESDVGLCMGVMCHLMWWYREENSDRTLCTYYLYCPFLLLTNFTAAACIPNKQNVSAILLHRQRGVLHYMEAVNLDPPHTGQLFWASLCMFLSS